MNRYLLAFTIFVGTLLQQTASLHAQMADGNILGTLKDHSGGIIQGGRVEVKNEETGVVRTGATNAEGHYSFPSLPVGTYQVSASYSGFQTTVRRGVGLNVGQDAVVDFTLDVSGQSEAIEIVGEASPVNTTSSSISHLVDNAQVRDLPLNGRDLAQLASLQMGVIVAPVAGNRRTFSIGGARPDQTAWLLDGADINDQKNWTPGSAAGTLLGVDTLQEFEVITNNYSAEFGRSPGGVVNAVTRSGSNRITGTVFEYLRNDNLDAPNYFDIKQPEFKRNQFGATVGGPIRKDRTFFLGSYEGLRQGLGLSQLAVVPNVAARQGLLPSGPGGSLVDVGLSSSTKPYLSLYPLPNTGRDFGDGTAEFNSSATAATSENYFLIRIDHHISDNHDLFGRYSFDNAALTSPDSLKFFSTLNDSRSQYLTLEEKWVVSPRILNRLRLTYNRSRVGTNFVGLDALSPSLSFVPGLPIGQTSISGMTGFGPSQFSPSRSAVNIFEMNEGITSSVGVHSLKFGVDVKRLRNNNLTAQGIYGTYSFTSLRNFLTATPNSTTLPFPGSDAIRGWRQWMMGFYAQDDIRWKATFTWNLGLRYEFVTIPHEANNKVSNLRDIVHDTAVTLGDPLFQNPSLKNFMPRVGFAWDPYGNGKTSVRAGFGVFYEEIWTDAYKNPGSRQAPYFRNTQVLNPVFPHQYELVDFKKAAVTGGVDTIQYNLNSPSRLQYNLDIQKQLFQNMVFNATYVGARDMHQFRLLDSNLSIAQILPDGRPFFAAGLPLRNPAFGSIRHKATDGNAYYNSLQVGIRKRFARGFAVQSSYSFSKLIDEGTITVTSGEFQNGDSNQYSYDRISDRGLSNLDIRHNWVLNGEYEVPSMITGNKPLNYALSSWQFNGIFSVASGNGFTALIGSDQARVRTASGGGAGGERPDLASGKSNNPVLGGPDKYFDPTAFVLQSPGFFGNVGRDTIIGPGLLNLDFSFAKAVHVGERLKVQFKSEFFNLFNRANFDLPSNRTIFASGGVRVGAAGRITSTKTTARQIQLGLRLSF